MMKKHKLSLLLFLAVLSVFTSYGQDEKTWIRQRIEILASPDFHGRGYVMNGGDIAANYIADEMRLSGVKPIRQNGSYFQDYTFSVNTFPGNISFRLDDVLFTPGKDYIVNAASSEWHMDKPGKLDRLDLSWVKDEESWQRVKEYFEPGGMYYLTGADTPGKYLHLGIRKFAKELPTGLFVVPKHKKLIWTASQDMVPATIIYIEDTVVFSRGKKVEADITNMFVPEHHAKNVIGYVPGTEVKDSFIVFTAHYDHLGRMGRETVFPGANDNASGTSLVLYLAHYFAKHPQRYSVAFMLFSGEEAGLLGSKHYVSDPLFPLDQIRFLVNLDMTADATGGITVVNGVSHEPEFKMLQDINKDSIYASKIVKRERTSNSDHYHFSKKGVPAVFIYGHGTKPYYHDVFDVPSAVSLNRVDDLAHLLIKFTGELTGTE